MAKEFQKRRSEAVIEYPLGDGRTIDLVIDSKLAVEVETGESDAESNVNKLLDTNFDALFVCTDKSVKQEVEERIKSHAGSKHMAVTEVRDLPEFVSSLYSKRSTIPKQQAIGELLPEAVKDGSSEEAIGGEAS